MAIVSVCFASAVLERTVPLQAVLPIEGTAKPLPTLYLLHGLHGCETDWFQLTRVPLWARELGLAVICPAGENSFYGLQEATGVDYLRFIAEELPAFTRKLFPLSSKREETFIGGLSMGGHGALMAGLSHPETFGKIVALSSALEPWRLMEGNRPETVRQPRYAQAVFGGDHARWDPLYGVEPSGTPQVWMGCGASDALAPLNRAFVERMREKGLPVHYEETEGDHCWAYWDREMGRGMRWLMNAEG